MRFLIPWQLLEWARDNRVLRVKWFGLEAEFAQPAGPAAAPIRRFAPSSPLGGKDTAAALEARGDLPEEERARQIREHERRLQEEVLFHSS